MPVSAEIVKEDRNEAIRRMSLRSADPERNARRKKIRFILVFVGLQISLFIAALDNTILAASLPTIGSDFKSMSISSWIVTSYAMSSVVFQPLFSKFSDIIGRKPIILFCLAVFLIGSTLCAVSKTMVMLIISRAIQGIGASGIFSLVYVIISDIIPLEKLGSYQGITTGVFALASVTGPLIGGSITDHLSWRWNFYINIPLGGVGIAIVYFFLHMPVEDQKFKDKLMRIDYAGNLLVLVAATLFLLAMNFGGQTYPWGSAAVIVPLVLSGVFTAVLVVVELKFAKEPLLPPRLFKSRSVVGLLLISLLFGLSYFVTIYYLPMYFQTVRGESAMWSGIRMIPLELSTNIFAIVFGIYITKSGYYRSVIVVSMFVLTLGIGLFNLFTVNVSWPIIFVITIAAGIGMGGYFASCIISIQASVEKKDIAVAIGLQRFTMAFGGAIGISIASAALNSSLRSELPKVVPLEYATQIFESPEFIRDGLPPQYFGGTIEAYANSIRLVWQIMTITAGLGLLSSFIVKAYSISGGFQNSQAQEASQTQQEYVYELEIDTNSSTHKIENSKELQHSTITISDTSSVRHYN